MADRLAKFGLSLVDKFRTFDHGPDFIVHAFMGCKLHPHPSWGSLINLVVMVFLAHSMAAKKKTKAKKYRTWDDEKFWKNRISVL